MLTLLWVGWFAITGGFRVFVLFWLFLGLLLMFVLQFTNSTCLSFMNLSSYIIIWEVRVGYLRSLDSFLLLWVVNWCCVVWYVRGLVSLFCCCLWFTCWVWLLFSLWDSVCLCLLLVCFGLLLFYLLVLIYLLLVCLHCMICCFVDCWCSMRCAFLLAFVGYWFVFCLLWVVCCCFLFVCLLGICCIL